MPLLVALDEHEAAMRTIAIHAELGLAGGPTQADAALRAILVVCERVESVVTDVLSHPAATLQAYTIESLAREVE